MENNEVLLLSEYVLFESAYGEDIGHYWPYSTLRTLLNNDFSSKAGLNTFTSLKTLKTFINYTGTYETEDKIFFLACVFVPSDQAQALAQDSLIKTYFGESCESFLVANNSWWLRSSDQGGGPQGPGFQPCLVSDSGYITGDYSNSVYGVRPAFVLNLA